MDHFFQDIQGWFGFADAYDYIISQLPANRPSTFVEVGTWKGASTAYLGVEIINSGKPITLVAVDTFEGSDEEIHRQDPDIHRLREVFDQNLAPVAEVLGSRFRVLQMTSQKAAVGFPAFPVDAVWLDASHELMDVAQDIEAWWPAIQPGGWLGGDDFAWPGVYQAVARYFDPVTVGNLKGQQWWIVNRGS